MAKYRRPKRTNVYKTTRATLQKAFYQYLVDHTFPCPKGQAVSMLLPTENDLARKIRAREQGYKRFNDSTAKQDMHRYRIAQKQAAEFHRKYEHARRNGTWTVRTAIRVRAKLKKYIDKNI
jgi:hypothetical protein